MDLRVTPLVLLLTCSHISCAPGDPVMFLPPLEVRSLDANARSMFPLINQQFSSANTPFQPVNQDLMPMPQHRQQIFHTSPATTEQHISTTEAEPVEKEPVSRHHNFTVSEFMEALNGVADHNEEGHESRAAGRDYEYPPSSYRPPGPFVNSYYPRPQSYGPPISNYNSPSGYGPPSGYGSPSPGYSSPPPSYQPPAAYVPPTTVHHTKVLKPELDILKPVKTKIASKVSGLIGLVLTLLTGSAPHDLELTGFKDIVVNGIIKPLLIAKGGIKSLISKLAIPVISLLLINLEVLITIWWLWEECPAQEHPTPYVYPYPKPPQY